MRIISIGAYIKVIFILGIYPSNIYVGNISYTKKGMVHGPLSSSKNRGQRLVSVCMCMLLWYHAASRPQVVQGDQICRSLAMGIGSQPKAHIWLGGYQTHPAHWVYYVESRATLCLGLSHNIQVVCSCVTSIH